MDFETLLTGTKWEILEILAKRPQSPLQLSKSLHTSIANISQQLRLLQAAGIVDKKRTGAGKPGKPRTMFSLADNFAFITIISQGFAQKKLVKITNKQKEVLKGIS